MIDLVKYKYISNQKAYNKQILNVFRKIDNSVIKTVAILVENEERLQEITTDIEKTLGIKKQNITPLIFKEKLKKEEHSPAYFTKKDFKFRGKIVSKDLQGFIKKDFDLLISYAIEANLYVNMITLYSEAKFKVGFAQIDDRLYDLIVKEPSFSTKVLHKEIHKYLSILKKIK